MATVAVAVAAAVAVKRAMTAPSHGTHRGITLNPKP